MGTTVVLGCPQATARVPAVGPVASWTQGISWGRREKKSLLPSSVGVRQETHYGWTKSY